MAHFLDDDLDRCTLTGTRLQPRCLSIDRCTHRRDQRDVVHTDYHTQTAIYTAFVVDGFPETLPSEYYNWLENDTGDLASL
jgi:hypothetical protein